MLLNQVKITLNNQIKKETTIRSVLRTWVFFLNEPTGFSKVGMETMG